MWPPERRSCEECGASYQPRASRQRYCSRLCNERRKYRRRHPLTPIPCAFCEQEFAPANGNAKYCSSACLEKAKYRKLRADPEKWAASLARLRASYVPKGRPPGPPPQRVGCSEDGCEEKHLARGFCRRHYYRDRRRRGLDGARTYPVEGLHALVREFDRDTGDWIGEPWSASVLVKFPSATIVWVDCPKCRRFMYAHPATEALWNCSTCLLGVKLNEEEVAWLYAKHSTEQRTRTAS